MLSGALIRYVCKAAVRDRLIVAMLVLMALAGVLSLLLSGAVIVEQQQFTLASLASSMRVVAVIGLAVFISFFQRRAHESREVDYLLATPLGRYRYLLSTALAYTIIALFLSLAMTLVLMVIQRQNMGTILFWGASVFVELSLVSSFTLFIAVRLRSATVCALLSLAFYSLARMLGAVLGVIDSHLLSDMKFIHVLNHAVDIIAIVIPRFDVLGQSQWLIYNQVDGLTPLFLLTQWIVFSALFLACAVFDLRRNQF